MNAGGSGLATNSLDTPCLGCRSCHAVTSNAHDSTIAGLGQGDSPEGPKGRLWGYGPSFRGRIGEQFAVSTEACGAQSAQSSAGIRSSSGTEQRILKPVNPPGCGGLSGRDVDASTPTTDDRPIAFRVGVRSDVLFGSFLRRDVQIGTCHRRAHQAQLPPVFSWNLGCSSAELPHRQYPPGISPMPSEAGWDRCRTIRWVSV